MLVKYKKLLESGFFRGSFILLVGVGISNVLGYLFHLVAGRFLKPGEYGLMQSYFSMAYFLGVFLNAVSFSVINYVGQVKEEGIYFLVKGIEKKFTILCFVIFFGMLSLFPILEKALGFESFFVYFIFSIYGFLGILSTLYGSVLRGRLKFFEYSFIFVGQALVKLIFGFLFLSWGFKVAGAIGSILLQAVFALVSGYFLVLKFWGEKKEKIILAKTNFWGYSLMSLMVSLALTSLYSIDILLVRYFFTDFESGIYGAVSILGKIIFFGATSILLVSFPFFTKYKRDLRRLRRVFGFSFLFLAGICFLGIGIFFLFPDLVVGSLFGMMYKEASRYLFIFSIFISGVCVLNLLVQLLLALEKKTAVYLSLLACLGQIILIVVFHGNLEEVIWVSIISLGVSIFFGGLFVLRELRWLKAARN